MSRVGGGGTKKRARGEGGIRLHPDGRWEATLDLGAEGARRRRKFIYGKTKAEVRKALAEARRQQEEGTLITGRPPTVAQLLDAWLVSVKGNVRHKTYVSYEGTVRLHINPWIGRARVDRLTGSARPLAHGSHGRHLYARDAGAGRGSGRGNGPCVRPKPNSMTRDFIRE